MGELFKKFMLDCCNCNNSVVKIRRWRRWYLQ